MLRDMTTATMSKRETDEVNAHLTTAGKLFNQISGTTLRELQENRALAQLIEQFNNTYVRKGQVVTDSKGHARKLVNWIS